MIKHCTRLLLPATLLLSSPAMAAESGVVPATGKVQFNRDIRPILSDKCFHCHGPDSQKREADMRLDVREAAIQHEAIIPNQPGKSLIMDRILSHDPDEVMPPPASKLGTLTAAEIDTLKRWIEQGAEYEAHWAFIPLKPVTLPAAEAGGDIGNPIDALVSAGLKERGLALQPDATQETLIRRVSFDLTGLPPTPAEVEAFVADTAPDAYERLVDRLLRSEAYGERMAVDWLDIARYADSYGFQVDSSRDVWPWRDWVIQAFNRNLPFDKFVTWQLAGDLLPNPTDEQVMATAFNRLHQQESEGGSVEEEYRVEYVADRVQTFATAFLGLTFECARCHDHKFDPIPHKDYYQLFAMFQNVDESGLYSYFTPAVPTPALAIADGDAKAKLAGLQEKVMQQEQALRSTEEAREPEFQQWMRTRRTGLVPVPGELVRYRFDTLQPESLQTGTAGAQPMVALRGENQLVPGREGRAVQFSGDDPLELSLGNFKRHEPFSVSLWMKTPDVKDRAVAFHRSRAWMDAASRGYELIIEEGKLKWSLIHFWPGNAISIRAQDALPVNQWVHVTVTSDGSSRAGGLHLYVNGKLADVETIKDGLTKDITGGGKEGDNITLGERFRDKGFKGGLIDDFRVFGREVTPLEVHVLSRGRESQAWAQEDVAWRQYYLATEDPVYTVQLEDLQATRAQVTALADSMREIMVMRELPQPKKAYTLFRGEYNARRDEVFAGTPEALPPQAPEAPRNRLGLAQWLTRRDHPLFARVTVNRFWQAVFGSGLVKTAEDFGSQGAQPVYPTVLDWLALRFMDSGWDVKAVMKTMVMSQTYRQRSIADAQVMADDPNNEWLARGPRFRLPAEMIRDNALATSGLLKSQVGGPPVFSYEMSEAFKPMAASTGADVYRRSIYSNWRRTSPPPAMVTFDAPRRAVCTAKRERTDSPLQALVLLNGVQYVEAARVLGERLLRDAKGSVSTMTTQAFMACLSRKPDATEHEIVGRLYEEQLAHFRAHPEEAEALLKTGTAPRDGTLSVPESAAATVLAQALMNHDVSVVKR